MKIEYLNSIKKLTVLVFGALLAIQCTNDTHKGYTITGTISGADAQWVKILKPNFADREAKPMVIDSAQVLDGSFTMKGIVEDVDMMNLTIDSKYSTMGGFLLENSPITLEIDLSKADGYGQFEPLVKGSKMQDEYTAANDKIMAAFNDEKYATLIAITDELREAYRLKDTDKIAANQKKLEALKDLQEARYQELQDAKIAYAKAHPNSPVATYILGFQFSEGRMDKETMKEVYAVFDGAATKTAMFGYYKKTYTEIFESLSPGATVPDFTLTTVDGKELTLSKVAGNYILVDFWASWCVPCRASFPHLKELYKKYKKDGFNVVAVGTADKEADWRKAIIKDETPWNHVFDTAAKERAYGPVSKKYGVPFLPTTFLIDGEGVIVARQLGEEDLDAKLKELYGY